MTKLSFPVKIRYFIVYHPIHTSLPLISFYLPLKTPSSSLGIISHFKRTLRDSQLCYATRLFTSTLLIKPKTKRLYPSSPLPPRSKRNPDIVVLTLENYPREASRGKMLLTKQRRQSVWPRPTLHVITMIRPRI